MAVGTPSVPASPAGPDPDTRRAKMRALGLGLFLTLLGLVLVAVLLPTAPGDFVVVLPVAAAGLVLLWVGGVLLGRGSKT